MDAAFVVVSVVFWATWLVAAGLIVRGIVSDLRGNR